MAMFTEGADYVAGETFQKEVWIEKLRNSQQQFQEKLKIKLLGPSQRLKHTNKHSKLVNYRSVQDYSSADESAEHGSDALIRASSSEPQTIANNSSPVDADSKSLVLQVSSQSFKQPSNCPIPANTDQVSSGLICPSENITSQSKSIRTNQVHSPNSYADVCLSNAIRSKSGQDVGIFLSISCCDVPNAVTKSIEDKGKTTLSSKVCN
ncbi:unnamed protein product [Protopolystoma xenopodis]|uniref:Uncharacterized protein n=1 Tax=Protopolystoma xenopodis TaxID=117903 RepID=A0A448XKU4_9PLAT|nr:unnamed protein product [Protopolystoma xenopodis]